MKFHIFRFILGVLVLTLSACGQTAKQPLAPTRQDHIAELFENGTINIRAQGISIDELSISIENLYGGIVVVEISMGTYFVPQNSKAQDMVVTKSQEVTLFPGESQELIMNVACASINRDIPTTNDTFAVQKSDSEDLYQLLRFLEAENAYYDIKQAAIWIVTDNADYEDLGILVGESSGPPGFSNFRIIGVTEVAKAMQIVDEAGIDITSRRIWNDREFIADRATNKFFSEWIREREQQGRLDLGQGQIALDDDSGLIAFYSERDGNWEIYVMNADGSNQVRLTYNPVGDVNPTWSPDARHIAFESIRDGNWEIYVMNADGSNQVRLTNNSADDGYAAWSPDGKHIAFFSERDGNLEIYVMDADGGNQDRLTNNPAEDWDPAWSPDGQQIAFYSNRDGNFEIYVMDADGGNQVRLTNNSADDGIPVWSPDGQQIAFDSIRDGNWEIYVMDADGGNQVRLTNNSADDWAPVWSPDGQYIVFVSGRDGNWEIYIMDVDGNNQINLTNNSAGDWGPAWQP